MDFHHFITFLGMFTILICAGMSIIILLFWIIFVIVDKIKKRMNIWSFKEKLKPEIGKEYVLQDGDLNPFKQLHVMKIMDIKQDKKGNIWIVYQYPHSKMYSSLWNHKDWKEYKNEP